MNILERRRDSLLAQFYCALEATDQHDLVQLIKYKGTTFVLQCMTFVLRSGCLYTDRIKLVAMPYSSKHVKSLTIAVTNQQLLIVVITTTTTTTTTTTAAITTTTSARLV